MKKLLLSLGGILVVASLVGCSKPENNIIGTWVNPACGTKYALNIFKDGEALKIKTINDPNIMLLSMTDKDTFQFGPSRLSATIKLVNNDQFFTSANTRCATENFYKISDATVTDIQESDAFLAIAKKGNAKAQDYVGYMYLIGSNGVAEDYTQAFDWLSKSASTGSQFAQYYLAYMYANGYGVSQNYTKSFELHSKLATANYGYGYLSVGDDYENGHGVAKNYQTAFAWYDKASKSNEPRVKYIALKSIGDLYAEGLENGKPNMKLACKYYRDGGSGNKSSREIYQSQCKQYTRLYGQILFPTDY